MHVSFRHPSGLTRQVKVGFSWTIFFFGGIPFFFRGLPIHGLGWTFAALFTMGFTNIIICFIGNRQTAHAYLERGYKPVGTGWDVASLKWGVSLDALPK
ncbi:MAG: hypothetical protein OEV94_02335 [Deltaproteobacteria bacterium]|nr:hypothetical protein [Deltaproteobacteria bacterium]